jgi:hypothetical protein
VYRVLRVIKRNKDVVSGRPTSSVIDD